MVPTVKKAFQFIAYCNDYPSTCDPDAMQPLKAFTKLQLFTWQAGPMGMPHDFEWNVCTIMKSSSSGVVIPVLFIGEIYLP